MYKYKVIFQGCGVRVTENDETIFELIWKNWVRVEVTNLQKLESEPEESYFQQHCIEVIDQVVVELKNQIQ